MTKVKEQYIYESEKPTKLNQLLQEIQSGVRLRTVRTNDRSKPNLEGCRKFRRQKTIEEQLMKSESRAQLARDPSSTVVFKKEEIESESPDEMDDIDRLRDDLQSTKQLLSIELRNKEAQDRENKRLLSKIANLENELEKFKLGTAPDSTPLVQYLATSSADEKIVNHLKEETERSEQTAKQLEKKFHDAAEQLDTAKSEIERQKQQIAALEKKLQQVVTVRKNLFRFYLRCFLT